MKWLTKIICIGMLLMIPLSGCQSQESSGLATVPFEDLQVSGTSSLISVENEPQIRKELYIPLTSTSDLIKHLDLKSTQPDFYPWPPKQLDKIDFDKEIGLLLTRGLKGIGGVKLQITKIERDNNNIYVRVNLINPSGPATAVEEYGVTLLKVAREHLPKGKLNIIFVDQSGKVLNQSEITN